MDRETREALTEIKAMLLALNDRIGYYNKPSFQGYAEIKYPDTVVMPQGDIVPTECCGQVYYAWDSLREHRANCPFHQVESDANTEG